MVNSSIQFKDTSLLNTLIHVVVIAVLVYINDFSQFTMTTVPICNEVHVYTCVYECACVCVCVCVCGCMCV